MSAALRERVSTALFFLAFAYMAGALWLMLLTGGGVARLAGVSVTVSSPRKVLVIALLISLVALLLSASPLKRAAAWRLARLSDRALALLLAGVFGLPLVAAKLWQHHVFQTCAYDLGLYTSAAWNTAYGRPFYDSVMNMNYLGDHFSPFFAFFAPLFWLGADASMFLALQSLGLGAAVAALYLLAARHLPRWPALALTALFASNYFLHQISQFDFHPVALGIPLFLWMLYFVETERPRMVAVLAVVTLLIEEPLIPALAAFGLYVAIFHPSMRRLGLAVFIGATVYFALVLKVFMPYFLGRDQHTHIDRYSMLGSDLSDILNNVVKRPSLLLSALVTPPEKLRHLAHFLASLAFLPLLAPRRLLLAVVPLLILLLSSSAPQWTFSFQYPAVALPFAAYASIFGLRRVLDFLDARRWALAPQLLSCGLVVMLAYNVSHCPHYVEDYDAEEVRAVHRVLRMIPPGSAVCATHSLVPHLVTGNEAYLLEEWDIGSRPERWDPDRWPHRYADYVLLLEDVRTVWGTYPYTPQTYNPKVQQLLASPRLEVVARDKNVVLLRVKAGALRN